ncbi:CIC11C00000002743 [Sungouiella intermedia]|uniref:Vacuolar protein sorting-associated protein n=1 Tax=Sungouiella intermedia TaxID=45354 RepID=A0A1L0G197_9ASCO|nr:CIC11C00000002743 [[Candida] intermedia]
MFESLVATLLNRFLGSYIENFDSKQLNIGIWGGDVCLKNLRLKKESLDKFKLPLDVKFGHLGELTLQIPWSNLKGKPVKVIIEDVYLLASPIILTEYDPEEDFQREQKLKQEKLKDLEAIQSAIASNQLMSLDVNNESFTESLVTKIVDNLQVTIKNIHIRYEDDSVLTDSPYSLGLTLGELSAASTDENWEPSFISITRNLTRKLLLLKKFACYMNTESGTIFNEDPDILLRELKQYFSAPPQDYQFLLKPVSGQGHLSVHKDGATLSHPHIRAELFFEEFGIDFDSSQYRDILWTALKFHWYQKTWKFRKLRPKTTVEENPREWFQYAAKSVLDEIHDKNYKWSWEFFKKRRDQRKKYIELWKKKLLKRQLSPDEDAEFASLEEQLSYEDIKFYRSLTRSEVRKQNLVAPKSEQQQASGGGWFSWWGGGKKQDDTIARAPTDEGGLDLTLTDEQRKTLYETIDYDENQELNSVDIPKDRNTMEVFITLEKAGISLKPVKNGPSLAEVAVEGCTTQFYQRPDSFLANFQMKELKVEDGTEKTLYKHIVSVKHVHSHLHSESSSESSSSNDEPFFQISFENNPLDGSADSVLLAKLKSMTIFYNCYFIEEIIKFFTPPKIHLDTVGAIMNAAEATVEGFTSQTRLGLQYALEEHKTINVKLDLQAPLVILPRDPTSWKSPVAILDAGHISVTSDLVDKKTFEEIKAKESYSEADWNKLNTLMYDRFNLHLQDAQFLVGPTIKKTMEQLHTENVKQSAVVVDNLDIKLSLGISILPDAANLARFKVGGEIPGINVSLNDFQYKTIMELVDVLIPDTDVPDGDSENVFESFGHNVGAKEISDVDSDSEKSLTAGQIAQHMFEMDFKVGQIQVSISRCLDAITLEAEHMIDLVGDSLNFFFYKTTTDIHVDLSLTDINVIDHIESSGVKEFEKLVTSNYFTEEDEIERRHAELFKVDYSRVQRIVDFRGKEIEVFDQDIKVDMSAVKFVVSRKSYLIILNFLLNTFTDPTPDATEADQLNHNDSENDDSPQKINVDVNLDSIIVVLNEDGVKLATVQLSTADVNVFILPEELEVSGKLGALTLHDESNQGSPRNSIFRSLISIEGDNLATFNYKTYDAEKNLEPYLSSVQFNSAAIKINFVEDAFGKIFAYLSKFLKMKAIYDSAREAAINQANQIDNASSIKLDFLVHAPKIYFPKLVDPEHDTCDMLIAELGELYLNNKFETIDEIQHNFMSAGIRNVNLFTKFHFDEKVEQVGQILDDLDISFLIDYVENYVPELPTFSVTGKLPEIDMKLTELQLRYMYNLQNSLTQVFEIPDDDESLDEVAEDAENANAVMKYHTDAKQSKNVSTLSLAKHSVDHETGEAATLVDSHPKHKQVTLVLDIPRISLTLFNRTKGVATYDDNKLTLLAINDFHIAFDMTEDTHFVSDLTLDSLKIKDVREGTSNKFQEIIPPLQENKKQLIVNASTNGDGNSRSTTVMVTVESPKTILALDHIFELQSFAAKGTELDTPIYVGSDDEESDDDEDGHSQIKPYTNIDDATDTSPSKVGFSVTVVDPSVILLADSTRQDTEAIVFKIEHVLITSQNIISLAANKIGMFVVKMDNFDDQRLRIIDDFSVSFAFDDRGSNPNTLLTNIQLSVDPLLVRISLRDIRLATQIAERANSFYAKAQQGDTVHDENADYNISEDFKSRLSRYAPSIISKFSYQSAKHEKHALTPDVIVKGEEFNGNIGGARLVLIGDVHELPVIDMNVKPFEVKVLNWSTELSAETHIESAVNIYNYAKSTWEPLLEPWPIAVYASKVLDPKSSIIIDVVSREMAQLSVSSRSIALLSQISSSMTVDELSKPREEVTPYVIKNDTGFDVEVWIDRHDGLKDQCTKIPYSNSQNWAFEDWRKIRENLDTDNNADILGVKLLGTEFEEILDISASGEGEDVFTLYPPVDGVHSRLVCEITLGSDNVKTILLRSTVTVQNDSETCISLKMVHSDASKEVELLIEPDERKSLPIGNVYDGRMKIKPYMETQFNWSLESMEWKDLMLGGTPLSCSSVGTRETSYYYFQAEAKYDKDEPLTSIYPHMTVVVSAPLEIENLLPFDINFRLYDKTTKRDWSGSVSKGLSTFVHVITLKSLLLLSVQPQGCGFGKSEFAIINTVKGSEFKQERYMTIKNDDGQTVRLKMHYPKNHNSRTNLRVVIYSPYVVLNRTRQNLFVTERGRSYNFTPMGSKADEANIPHLFSFEKDKDNLNRVLARLGDSDWSDPLSFDAIGQNIGVKAPVKGTQLGMNFGVTVAEGEGKYQLSKVITFAPRYVLRNALKEPIMIVENGSTKQFELAPDDLTPLYNLRRNNATTMLLKFAHHGKAWSSPFGIDEIGQVFLKVQKEGFGQVLLKVNIITENATVFIHVENANNNWPFSIRNFSDSEFFVYQSNPNVDLNGEVVKNDVDYKPIYYKVPPRSVMPYAYDYPNAVVKDLVIRSHGRERAVNLAEIGNLKPFRLPPTDTEDQVIVDLNVVADGPTQSLVISKYDPSVSLYKIQEGSSSNRNLANQQFEVDEKDENYHTKILTRFEGFGISIINTRKQELCYITLRGVEIRYNESDLYQNLSLKLKWIQVDNQLYGGIFPIIIYPTVVPKSGKEMNNHPSFSASVCKVKDDSHGVLFIKYATVLLQEMSLEIDEDFLFALLDFSKIPGASWNVEVVDKLCDNNLEIPEPKKLSEASDIYFEALHLQPTLTNLSFVRTERVNAEDRTSSQNTLMFFVNMLTMAIGNINDAPIKLNALLIENVRVPLPILVESISTHYGQSFFYQIHKILGSADFLGNPVGLFNNLSSGVLDIFYEPYHGFVINDRPQELGIGIAKGGLSFVKKSVFGFSDSFAKVTGSIAKGLTVATMDSKFQERRRLNQRRNKPKHALYGVASGANSFFESVSSGFTGIAQAPIEGAAKDGAGGFFKGLGKGLIGLPTKTAIGVFDLASNVSEGIRNTTTVLDAEGLDKVRLPRYISYDGVIRPYSQREAQGQYWLKSIDGGSYFNETYLAHLVLPGEEKAILVTFHKIILFSINTLKVVWIISFDEVATVSLESTGITVMLKKNRDGPFIPIPEKRSRLFLYSRLKVAVDKFNKHCKVIL